MTQRKSQRGFSLLETAIVLGVIGAILGGIWTLATLAWENARQEKATEQISSIVRNVRAYHAGKAGISGTFLGLATILYNAQVFPGDAARATGTGGCTNGVCIDHPWALTAATATGGSLGVCPWVPGTAGCAAGTTAFFSVEFRDVPVSSCVKLAVANSGPNAPPGLVDVFIDNNSMVALNRGLPPRATDARGFCMGAATAQVDFVYRLANPGN